ncbi:M1 family metallopeptidase [Nocardioides sp.]|uniref:M1 family metallopeptidase n=1 Tax=Nocardioides sp. TaxID=35761 RepID=UPI003528A33F
MSTTRTVTRLAAIAATAAVALPSAAYAVPSPGADGAGDPYFPTYGNGGYDVGHYDIHVDYGVATHKLKGVTTVKATATQDLSSFNLDLALKASKVTVDGVDAGFSQSGQELVVTPVDPILTDDTFAVTVTYAGNPAAHSDANLGGWFLTSDGAIAAGEPEVAAVWYPSNDHPSDKASFDVYVTTKATKKVIGNGVLRGVKKLGAKKRWHWKTAEQMTTYLATVVIGDYRITRGRTKKGVPWLNAVTTKISKGQRQAAVLSLEKTPAIVDFYSSKFGAYPFSITGGIIGNASFGFSLENQTRPIYSKVFFGSGAAGANTEVVAHELAHMWWGDSVSVSQWKDIWLNEGFATWSSWLWAQRQKGVTLNGIFRSYYRYYRGNAAFWTIRVDDPGPDDVFDWAVYDRGAMAVQALRNRIGATAHTKLLRKWARVKKYGNGSVAEFEAMAEQVSGKDLTDFFDAWLHQTTRPLPSKALGFPASMLGRPTTPAKPLPVAPDQSLRRRM